MLVNKLEKLYLVGKSVHSHPSLVFINAIQKHQNYRPFAQVTECIAKNNLSYYLQSHPHTKKRIMGISWTTRLSTILSMRDWDLFNVIIVLQ